LREKNQPTPYAKRVIALALRTAPTELKELVSFIAPPLKRAQDTETDSKSGNAKDAKEPEKKGTRPVALDRGLSR